MPAYFPEGDAPQPSDDRDRLAHKFASLADKWSGGNGLFAPKPSDSLASVYRKLVGSLNHQTQYA